jgi:pimeloyl-ACP methyl ester carboxylesterase
MGRNLVTDIRLSRYSDALPWPARPPVARPVPVSLVTADGVRLDAVHIDSRPDRGLAIVVVPGFTGSMRLAAMRRVAAELSRYGSVIAFDLRGHGRSAGLSTQGDREVEDIAAAVGYARSAGYRSVAAVGFSMGGSVALRYAASDVGLRAVVSVSSPERWHYRGTRAARRVQWAIGKSAGRLTVRLLLGTRVSDRPWAQTPASPAEAAAQVSAPLLIVHGDRDRLLPVEQARGLYRAAGGPKELWIEAGMGHAETGMPAGLPARIGEWIACAFGQERDGTEQAEDTGSVTEWRRVRKTCCLPGDREREWVGCAPITS